MIDEARLKNWVYKYLRHVNKIGLESYVEDEEGYKFKFVSKFQEKFNLEEKNLLQMLDSAIEDNNLTTGSYYWPRRLLMIFAEEYEPETRQALEVLFDEKQDVRERIDRAVNIFDDIMQSRNKKTGEKKNTYIGYRFLSLLLASRYPDKYYPIKPNEHAIFATYVDDDFKGVGTGLTNGARYSLHTKYANALNEYIKPLPEIQKIHSLFTADTSFKDPEYKWMTQDVIYTGAMPPPNGDDQVEPILKLLEKKRQVILYGPPGTGKTYKARNLSIEVIEGGISW